MEITIEDVKAYINELKIQKDYLEEYKSCFNDKYVALHIEWLTKQITHFERKLEEVN